MKALMALLWLGAFLAQASTQPKISDRERDGLVGPVYQVDVSLSERFTNFRNITTYSREGNLIKIETPYGNFHTIKTFKQIDQNTVMMRYIDVGASNMGQVPLAAHPLTDKDGGELYTLHYRQDSIFKRDGEKVTREGTSVQESVMTGDRLVWRVVCLFDPQKRLTEMIEVHTSNLRTIQTTYNYDNSSTRSPQYVEHRVDGIITRKEWFSYEFDDQGNWIKRTRVREEPITIRSPPNDVTKRTIIYHTTK